MSNGPYAIWFERPVTPELEDLVGERVRALGGGTPQDPWRGIEAASAVIASQLRYDAAVMDRAPQLRVISRTGIGYDLVDVAAATERGIAVCNAPDGPTISTAEHTVLLMLMAAKQVAPSMAGLRAGDTDLYAKNRAIELEGKILGLVGFGRIARRVARAAEGLGMRVVAFDPYLEEGEFFVEAMDSLNQLLSVADVVSVHVPLTTETRRLFDAERFGRMKPGAVFVNAARGGLVDHDALLASLDSGHLFAAGLDVTDPEPLPPHSELLARQDVVVTPHVASGTFAGRRRIFRTALAQAVAVLEQKHPDHLVNPEVWPAS